MGTLERFPGEILALLTNSISGYNENYNDGSAIIFKMIYEMELLGVVIIMYIIYLIQSHSN